MAIEYTAKQIVNDSPNITVFHLYKLLNYDGAGNNLYFCDLDEDYTHTDSNTYKAIPIKLSDITQSDDGKLNDATLAIGNADRAMEYYILNYELVGKLVEVIFVYDLNGTKQTQSFVFEITNIKTNEEIATFTLGIGLDVLKQVFPRRKVFSNHCMWKFKSTECGYTGIATTCTKTYQGCHNRNRFGGFPSVKGTMIWI